MTSTHWTRRKFMQVSGSAAALWMANSAVRAAGPKASRLPNILFVMTDQHRGDAVGCYGNKAIKTPHLDGIAAQGVRFPRAYSSLPSCTPARATLLTGQGAWRHGMLGYARVAAKYDNEMPQMLRDVGYQTLGIGKMHWSPQKGLHGFHKTLLDESGRMNSADYRVWFRKTAPGKNPDATGLDWNGYTEGPYKLEERLHPTRWTGDRAVEFLSNYTQDAPWFLKVSFARPHSPYDPPKRFYNMYKDADVPKPVKAPWAKKFARTGGLTSYRGDHGLDQVLRSRRAYYGNISFIDEQVGRMVDMLKKRGMLDNTLIVFTADHGDMLGDHNLWRKTYAYEGSARVPMLMSWPKGMLDAKLKRGSELRSLVELRDILPTFLDAANSLGSKYKKDRFDGQSMLDLVRSKDANWRTALDLEHSRCYFSDNQWNALTDDRYKYIFFSFTGREELYDLKNDPGEERDLAADPKNAKLVATYHDQLAALFVKQGRDERFVKNGKLQKHENILIGPNYPGYKVLTPEQKKAADEKKKAASEKKAAARAERKAAAKKAAEKK